MAAAGSRLSESGRNDPERSSGRAKSNALVSTAGTKERTRMRSRRLPVSPVHLVLAMLLVTLLGACDSGAGTRSAAVVPPAPKADVHSFDWRSASYNVSCPGLGTPANQQVAVTLAGGKGQSPAVPWFGPSVPIDVALVNVTYGDLTGDGKDDAVVHLTCNPHGSNGVADEVQVFGPGAELLGRPVL